MACKHHSGILAITAFLFITGTQTLRAQNVYPASGDAVIHGLTIGTGRGGQISNTALGDSALYSYKGSSNNTAVGRQTLFLNLTGSGNSALGYQAMRSSAAGIGNVAAGSGALYSNQTGNTDNVALGQMALYNDIGNNNGVTGEANTGVGAFALYSTTTGYENTAFGYHALYNISGASDVNTAFGFASLATYSTNAFNTAFGAATDIANSTLSYSAAIGYGAMATASDGVFIGNTSVTSIGGYANWTTFSDGRYKKNIGRNVPGLAFINLLDPITYTLDVDAIESRLHPRNVTTAPDGQPLPGPMSNPVMQQAMQEKSRIVHTGFVAQDVEKAAQSAGYPFSGVDKPKDPRQSFYGLRYSEFVVPLVKAAQELSAENDSLKAANVRLSARLDRIKQRLGIDSNAQGTSVLSLPPARLLPNTPNPFSETTIINYYVPKNSGPASLQITDMNGEIIKTIAVSGQGYGQVNLQTADLATGTYTYSLFVDGKLADTRKMVVGK
jgi:hypothetical protein